MKGTFCITGSKVQGVGYRPFLLGKFEDYNLSGRARNLPNGKEVEVTVWGEEKDMWEFYRHLKEEKARPKHAVVDDLTPLIVAENNQPEQYLILRHGQAVMAEQFSKAVDVQTEVSKRLRGMDKKLGKLDRLEGISEKLDVLISVVKSKGM